MNNYEAFKKPALLKLWLKKGVKVYLFLIVAVIGIKC
jgi:hypothetical protein